MSAIRKATAIIVGGSAGIGLALAREAVAAGCDVILVGRDAGRLDRAAAEIAGLGSGAVETLALDAFALDAPARIAEAIARRPGARHVVLAAARWHLSAVATTPPEEIAALTQANVVAPLAICRAVLPCLRPGDGILVVGSLAATMPLPWMSLYSASKAQLQSAVLAMRQEIAGSGIALSVLAPGAVLTDFVPRGDGSRWRWIVDLAASSPATVAYAGWRGFRAGVPLIVPGILWRAGWLAGRLLPASLLACITRRALQPLAPRTGSEAAPRAGQPERRVATRVLGKAT